jgi:hypothetical protein
MEAMRESWTDKRLDDLNEKVDRGFDRIDADIRGLRLETRTEFQTMRGEMKAGFDRVDARFERIDERFERMDRGIDARFEALHRLLFRSACALAVVLVGAVAAPI